MSKSQERAEVRAASIAMLDYLGIDERREVVCPECECAFVTMVDVPVAVCGYCGLDFEVAGDAGGAGDE